MTQVVRKNSRPPRSADSICREWRQVHLKAAYDLSMLDEHDDNGTDLIARVADANERELERDLFRASITSLDDAQAILAIALCLLREGAEGERPSHLVRLAHRGMYFVRNATTQARAA